MRHSAWAKAIKARDVVCQECGASSDLFSHHIVPKALGGKNTLDNGILLCRKHHDREHAGDSSPTSLGKRRKFGPRGADYLKAAVIIGVSQTTIYDWVSSGILPDGDYLEIANAQARRIEGQIQSIHDGIAIFTHIALPAVSPNEG